MSVRCVYVGTCFEVRVSSLLYHVGPEELTRVAGLGASTLTHWGIPPVKLMEILREFDVVPTHNPVWYSASIYRRNACTSSCYSKSVSREFPGGFFFCFLMISFTSITSRKQWHLSSHLFLRLTIISRSSWAKNIKVWSVVSGLWDNKVWTSYDIRI